MDHALDIAFLHGGGQGSWVWTATRDALRRRAPAQATRIVALDVPGCGAKRDRPDDGMDNPAIAAELVADLERAGLSRVTLVGHSQAGQILPFMARLRPGLFRRLVYLACSLPQPGVTILRQMGTGRRDASADEVGFPFDPATASSSERRAAMFGTGMAPADQDRFITELGRDRWPAATYAFTAWPEGAAPVPATYIVCDSDAVLPPAWQHRFAERLGVDRVRHLDAGHQAMVTAPDALVGLLLADAR